MEKTSDKAETKWSRIFEYGSTGLDFPFKTNPFVDMFVPKSRTPETESKKKTIIDDIVWFILRPGE